MKGPGKLPTGTDQKQVQVNIASRKLTVITGSKKTESSPKGNAKQL